MEVRLSGFEVVAITFSFVLGLGIAQLLNSLSLVLRARRRRRLDWLPLAYATSILLFQIQYWFALFFVNTRVTEWSWLIYGWLLFLSILLFLAGGLVLPHGETEGGDLLTDFESEGRLSVLLVSGYVAGWIPLNAYLDGTWFSGGVYFNALVTIVLLAAYFPHSFRLRRGASVVFFLLQAYGLGFIWSTPIVLR